MTKQGTAILKRAFICADIEDFRELPKEYSEWIPSKKFENRMKRLIQKQDTSV